MRINDLPSEMLPQAALLFEDLSGLPAEPDRLAAACEAMAASPDYHLLGAWDGPVLAGVVLGVVCLDCVGDCRPFLVVENLVVAASYRRRGLGRRLVEEVLRRGRERNCRYAMLVSGRAREAAHGLYAALGFTAEAGFKIRL